jgi:spore germination cell wall hydrolase CwlJ-like protein
MAGKDPSKGALFFYNPKLSSIEGLRFFASSGLEVTVRIGNHVFLK